MPSNATRLARYGSHDDPCHLDRSGSRPLWLAEANVGDQGITFYSFLSASSGCEQTLLVTGIGGKPQQANVHFLYFAFGIYQIGEHCHLKL